MMTVWKDLLLACEVGGSAVYLLIALLWFTWHLSLRHFWFMKTGFNRQWSVLLAEWQGLTTADNKRKEAIRNQIASTVRRSLLSPFAYLKIIVVVSPLCGLLGTVSGMIDVFEVVQRVGTGNVQALAAGISQATFSTAAGIVVSLMALTLHVVLLREARKKQIQCEEALES